MNYIHSKYTLEYLHSKLKLIRTFRANNNDYLQDGWQVHIYIEIVHLKHIF